MSETPNLGLTYLDAGQAQKHVTVNEALRLLDAATQMAVLDRTLSAPPASPVEGARHAVAAGATGAWSGHDLAIASWQDGAWAFLAPKPGWCAWSVADDAMLVFDGGTWRGLEGDEFDRLVIDKALVTDDAMLVLQTGTSTRALIGLLGSDDCGIKVSVDGSTFTSALAIDRSNGQLSLPQSPKFSAYMNFDKYCAASSWTKVQFNNGRHNDFGVFDAANNQFVAPAAGYYALGYRVLFKANATLPASLTATLYLNGAEIADDARMQTSSALVSNRSALSAQTVLKLAAGDTVAVWALMETNDGYISAAQNSFYGHRIP